MHNIDDEFLCFYPFGLCLRYTESDIMYCIVISWVFVIQLLVGWVLTCRGLGLVELELDLHICSFFAQYHSIEVKLNYICNFLCLWKDFLTTK